MAIKTGNRRLVALTEGLVTLIAISALAVVAPPHGVAVLTVTGGAVGIALSFYYGNDGKIKAERVKAGKEPE